MRRRQRRGRIPPRIWWLDGIRMAKVALKMHQRISSSKDDLVYIFCCVYVQTLVDDMVQNLVDDCGQCCIYVYIF
jgi:hypothetical protein